MTDGPIAGYRALLRAGDRRPDPAQELAAEKLQTLHRHLKGYQPPAKQGWRHRLGIERAATPPQGLYLYGGVGRGKTMMMDLFFDGAPVERKRRTHFHAFMAEVHGRIHDWRQDGREHGFRAGADPIPPLAAAIVEQAWLLCFDEFEVLDIADAMILGRLFTTLIEDGVVVVTTSNRPPRELYLDGLQRDRFEPFIALVEDRFDVLHLDGEVDYRLDGLRDAAVYFTPLGRRRSARSTTRSRDLPAAPRRFPRPSWCGGRDVAVPAANRGIARFGFADLCEQALGAADYLAIAQRYHTVVLSGLPRLAPEQRNEARRLAMLIDIFYDHAVKLICSADGPPESLYPHGTGAFEFKRTASRLIEMDRVPAGGVRALRSTRLPAGRAGTFRLPRWAA